MGVVTTFSLWNFNRTLIFLDMESFNTKKWKVYCDVCEKFQEVEIDDPLDHDADGPCTPWSDISCKKCHLIIATIEKIDQ